MAALYHSLYHARDTLVDPCCCSIPPSESPNDDVFKTADSGESWDMNGEWIWRYPTCGYNSVGLMIA